MLEQLKKIFIKINFPSKKYKRLVKLLQFNLIIFFHNAAKPGKDRQHYRAMALR